MKHERQHPDNPTWCVHCGRFDPSEDDACEAVVLSYFDERLVSGTLNILFLLFGPGEREEDRFALKGGSDEHH